MATISETLKSINAYPIPERTVVSVCVKRGIDPEGNATKEVVTGKDYNLARADCLIWLSTAPNISQGGQSYSFSESERKNMRNEALSILTEYGEDGGCGVKYGYKGNKL